MFRKLKLTFEIFVTSLTLKIRVTTPKEIGFLGGLWRGYILGFSLVAVILLKLSYRSGFVTEHDFCDLCDLENQGHDPKTNRVPQGPMGEQYTMFQFDSCNTF